MLIFPDAQSLLSINSGLLFANPIPFQYSIPKAEMDSIIAQALDVADKQGISGKDNTPFVLNNIRELTHGRSVPANRALIEANVVRGARVAVELAKLEVAGSGGVESSLGSAIRPKERLDPLG